MTKRKNSAFSFSEYYEYLASQNAEKLSRIKRNSVNEEKNPNNYEKILDLSRTIVNQNSNLSQIREATCLWDKYLSEKTPNDIAFTFLTTSLTAELTRIERILLLKTNTHFSEEEEENIEFLQEAKSCWQDFCLLVEKGGGSLRKESKKQKKKKLMKNE